MGTKIHAGKASAKRTTAPGRPQFWTVTEFAEAVRCSTSQVYKQIKAGKVKATTVLGNVRISDAEARRHGLVS